MDELENKCERMEEEERKYEYLARVLLGQPSTHVSSSDKQIVALNRLVN